MCKCFCVVKNKKILGVIKMNNNVAQEAQELKEVINDINGRFTKLSGDAKNILPKTLCFFELPAM